MIVQVTWLALSLCFIASIADMIGGSFTIMKKLSESQFIHVTALGAGFLLGATLLDRLPDSMSSLPASAPLYIVIGYLAVLLMETLPKRATMNTSLGVVTRDADSRALALAGTHALSHISASAHVHIHGSISKSGNTAALVALLIHTFMDGVIIAGSFSFNRAAGILMFIAITMHKLPEGFTMATISLAATDSRKQAFLSAFWLACSTMVGAGVTLLFGRIDAYFLNVIMALATGTFLFISTSSLMPIIREATDRKAAITVVIGTFIFYLSLVLVHHAGLT
jgi:zinc transporter ZupT